ncbi:prolyl-tRNA synthetase [Blastocystis sp. subtype 4]|uniref:prolyl-tRNA synthetase n=1 Tax=Blastocystis sp. subtype 4 TaxID=944170 RepID=UPI0007114C92|nr:prolyl-tRNA synthetase [Blastocystis sp. subtype 4]KNB42677.1 prolyl-tRNA synthetase [Blastocystis sp. subtype 4]|eukprot:XP_014526120.1 prolyl-tRNA synthetase [Blastocystis sp. subtype 4]
MARYGRLLLKGGYAHQTEPGMFSFLPLGQRVIDEMKKAIDLRLDEVGAQKMQMPVLQNLNRWDQTGRREKMGKELYTLKDRKGQSYCLSPTNEEVITSIVKDLAIPADYPMILYQTSSKFRDERRIFSSVLRSKEFLMMDAYSFDKSIQEASATFDRMDQCFKNIFSDLEIPVESLEADSGVMGGNKSREYQCLCGIGQDTVVKCSNCNYMSLHPLSTSVSPSIPFFESESFQHLRQDLELLPSVELGHMFLLGDRYSGSLDLHCPSGNVMMGCYGLGLSRMMGALFQLYGYNSGVLFPDAVTTYDVVLVNIAKSEQSRKVMIELLDALGDVRIIMTNSIRVLFDDRDQLSLGARLTDAELAGVRVAVIVGKDSEANGDMDIRLLHKPLIQDVLFKRTSDTVGDIHPVLRRKVESFDFQRLEQLGYKLKNENGSQGMKDDGFMIRSSFGNVYWNLIQTLSCIKTYSSKPLGLLSYDCYYKQLLMNSCPRS